MLAWVLFCACPGPVTPFGADGGSHDGGLISAIDGSVNDAGQVTVDGGSVDAGVVDAGPFDAGPEPITAIRPVPGALTVIQLDMPFVSGFQTPTGESAIIVGPDGTLALIDVGNSMHNDTVRNAIRNLNTTDLTTARGYAVNREALQVEWVLITHLHSDHMGGLAGLLSGADALKVTKGIVYRGMVDLGGSLSLSGNPPHDHFDSFCPVMRGAFQALERPLCHTTQGTPSCLSNDWGGNRYQASECDGLSHGDLSTSADDAAGAASFISLGGDARITLLGVNGYVRDGNSLVVAPAWAYNDNDQENARSLVGLLSQGAFRYVFAGDLPGSGSKDAPDLESFVIVHAAAANWATLGVDVSHANHHARKTSSGPAYTASLAPKDGKARNVIAGINAAYIGAPFTGVASPSKDALESWCSDNHLGGGQFWVTNVAAFSSTVPELVVAKSNVVLQTIQAGMGYRIQTTGTPMVSKAFASVRK